LGKRTLTMIFHCVAGRAVNRSLAWVAGRRFAESHRERPSVVAHFEDHGFLLSIDARLAPDEERLRAMFEHGGFDRDLRLALAETETLGARFRTVAEIGQLLPKRTGEQKGSWPGSLLYATLKRYEPDHPLVREAVREMLEDELDAARAAEHAARIRESAWEVFDLPRPSPFALPLFAFFHREVLMTQDPERALSDYTGRVYDEWNG
jgi:ATP-dependent Lhr-like helicase